MSILDFLAEHSLEEAKDLPTGSTFEDTTGSRYKVLRRYKTGRKLGGGAPDEGYVGEAMPGNRNLVKAGSIYHVPYVRVAKVIRKGSGRPAPMEEAALAEATGHPKKLEVVKGNKKLGAWTRDVYQVDSMEPFEDGVKLMLTRLKGQASSKRKLVLFVRYAKSLGKDEFNASRGDGVNKIKFRVLKRRQPVSEWGRHTSEERQRQAQLVEEKILAEAAS